MCKHCSRHWDGRDEKYGSWQQKAHGLVEKSEKVGVMQRELDLLAVL